MPKLNKQEYILRAAKLYGLGHVEIEALKNHLDGSDPNDFIQRKTEYLFRLYDIYKEENGEKIRKGPDGIINLNDFSFEKSRRRLSDSKIGEFWVIGANLDCFLVTLPGDKNALVKPKFRNISEKNNFLLPQLAKALGLDTALFYKGTYRQEQSPKSYYHLTKNFLRESDDTFIRGTDIFKDSDDKKKVKLENLLEATDKFIKKHYKKHKLPEEEAKVAREEIRRELIKQSFFNKYVFNENESNQKWGLVDDGTHRLRIAPLFSFDYCCGAEPTKKIHRRSVNGKEDIQTFMLKFGKEKWFRDWITDVVMPSPDLDILTQAMEEDTGVTLAPEEKEYYEFMFGQFKTRVSEVIEVNYNEKELSKRKRFANRMKDLKEANLNKKTVPTGNSDGHGAR